MNGELHNLFWYTRAQLVLIRRQSATASRKLDVMKHEKDDSKIKDRHMEVDNIICGIVHTIDDILTTEALLWNTLFLVHIIQSLTVHKSNLNAIHDSEQLTIARVLPMELNYVRIYCFIDTLLVVCQANLVSLCTTSHKANPSNTPHAVNKANIIISPMYQSRQPNAVKNNTKVDTPTSSDTSPQYQPKLNKSGSSKSLNWTRTSHCIHLKAPKRENDVSRLVPSKTPKREQPREEHNPLDKNYDVESPSNIPMETAKNQSESIRHSYEYPSAQLSPERRDSLVRRLWTSSFKEVLDTKKQDQCDILNRDSSNNIHDHAFALKKPFRRDSLKEEFSHRFDETHHVQENFIKRQSSIKSLTESMTGDKSARPDSLKKQLSNKSLNQACVDEKLGQINRLSSKLVSKDMTTMYAHAKQVMNNSITDTGVGLPFHEGSD